MPLNQVIDALKKVGETSGRNAKIAIIDSLVKVPTDRELLKEIVLYTSHPMYQYNMSPVLVDNSHIEPLDDETSERVWNAFRSVLDKLRNRQETGAAARTLVVNFLGTLPAQYSAFLNRVLGRDLKVGLATWDKWFPGLFPQFVPQLCDKWQGGKLSKQYMAERKLDGLRALVFIDESGDCTALSRSGKPLWNCNHIFEELKSRGLRNCVVDGEFEAGTFGESISITKSQTAHPKALSLRFFVFDILHMTEWTSKKSLYPLSLRKQLLDEKLSGLVHTLLVQFVMVQTDEEILEVMDGFVKEGYEGVVLKDPDSIYKFDRTADWLKVKPVDECDLAIYDIEEGKGRLAGTVGALNLYGTVKHKGKEYKIDTNCGTGLSDAIREELWAMHQRGELVGKVAEIKYQDVTAVNLASNSSASSATFALRFPVFFRMRPDKEVA